MDRLIKLEELDSFLNNFQDNLDYLLCERSKMEASGDDKKFFNKSTVDRLEVQIEELRKKIKTFDMLAEIQMRGYPIFIEDNIIVPDYSIL